MLWAHGDLLPLIGSINSLDNNIQHVLQAGRKKSFHCRSRLMKRAATVDHIWINLFGKSHGSWIFFDIARALSVQIASTEFYERLLELKNPSTIVMSAVFLISFRGSQERNQIMLAWFYEACVPLALWLWTVYSYSLSLNGFIYPWLSTFDRRKLCGLCKPSLSRMKVKALLHIWILITTLLSHEKLLAKQAWGLEKSTKLKKKGTGLKLTIS